MHRIDTSTAQKDKFGAGKNGFTSGNAQTGVPATEVSPDILDSMQEEICAVIEDADSGMSTNKEDNTQLVTAIKNIIAKKSPAIATSDEVLNAELNTVAIPPKHMPAAISKYAPVAGGYRNIKLSADGASANVLITAEKLVLDKIGELGLLLANNINITAVATATGTNGLDTGVIEASKWYSVWVISNGSDIKALLSLSEKAPQMPEGYTYRRRIGWIRTDASANKYPLAFNQHDNNVSYVIKGNVGYYPIMASGVAGVISSSAFTPVPVSVSQFCPITSSSIRIKPHLNGSGTAVAVSPSQSGYGGFDNDSNPPLIVSEGVNWGGYYDLCLETSNVYWASPSTSGRLFCIGWEDTL